MELPTYTSIWKIEKRLYKLYDFRLPMPLPVGQVAAFLAIAVPYTVVLTMAGMPFSHSWVWLYVLPPGALAWLVTRPVLEGKRLPELLLSQLRYLAEPRIWCRMAPLAERDQITVVARVWRSSPLAVAAGLALAEPAVPAQSAQQPMAVAAETRGSSANRAGGWRNGGVVLHAGHRPARADRSEPSQAAASLPLSAPARIVVLGCTSGAGQTTATWLTGHLLASMREDQVAAVDLSPGPGSLTERARATAGLRARQPGAAEDARPERRLQVITADLAGDEPPDAGRLINDTLARYPIVLADPAAAHVPRALLAADRLILIAPASADAAGALAMTLEWLQSHAHPGLARTSLVVLNGVTEQTRQHCDKATAIATGQCQAIRTVPWDGGLACGGPAGARTVRAYAVVATALLAALGVAEAAPAGAVEFASTPSVPR